MNPYDVQTHNNLGNVFQDQGKLDEAIDVYKKSLSLDPKNADSLNNMGVSLKKQGKLVMRLYWPLKNLYQLNLMT